MSKFSNFTEKIEHSKKVVAQAARQYKNIAVGCSFGKDSLAVVHLSREVVPEIPIFYVTTIYKPLETLEYAVQMNEAMRLNMKVYVVGAESPRIFKEAGIETALLGPAEFESTLAVCRKEHGKMLYEIDPDVCCNFLKVEPTKEAVKYLDAWVAGLRQDEGHTRQDFKEIEIKGDLVKINPILSWSELDVWRYLALNHIKPNPLYKKGYRSLGCAPCSNIVSDDAPERAGRWTGTKKAGGECGIHTKHLR